MEAARSLLGPTAMRRWSAWLPFLLAAPAWAEVSDDESLSEEEQAAKQSENPISRTEHLTIEDSASYLIGGQDRTLNVLTLTPILPVDVHPNWTVIPNARLPLVWAPDVLEATGGSFGLGDIALTFLLGPRSRSMLFWGLGLSTRLPTATNRNLGVFDSGQFSIGPAATVIVTPGHFVVGFSVFNVWSVAGRDDASDVRALTLQPLINYNLPQAWYLTSTPYILCDWTAPSDKCLVPIGAGIGKLALPSRRVALTFEAHAYWNAVRSDLGPPWNLRFQMTMSFPR